MEDHLSNDRLISFHRSKPDYIPPPENTLMFAYGDRRYEKFTYELTFVSNTLKLKIYKEISEDFHRADSIILALLSSDLLNVTMDHLADELNDIREMASRLIKQISSVQQGRDILMDKIYLMQISKLADDNVKAIRSNCYDTLTNISEFTDGVNKILETDILLLLVDKMIEEKENYILTKVLVVLINLLYGKSGSDKALDTPVISRLLNLLTHADQNLRHYSAKALSCLSFIERGKIDIIKESCVIPLCNGLQDTIPDVRIAISLTLSSLVQMKSAKVEILENHFFEKILQLLSDPSEYVRLNIVLSISGISEHPEGRRIAKGYLKKLEEMKREEVNRFLWEYIDEAIRVITWIP